MKYDLAFERGLVLHLNRRATHCTGQFHTTIMVYTFYLPSCFGGGLAGSFRALLLPLPLEDGVGGWFGEVEGEGEGRQQ